MSGTNQTRYFSFVEGVAFSGFIAWYIWRLQFTHPSSWLVFPVWLIVSFLAHQNTPKTLGWRADNLWPATRQAAMVFGVCILALCAAGIYFDALHRLPAHLIDSHRFFGYFSFCLLQQVALNSYLMDRFLSAVERPWIAALFSSIVFAALHWPNPVLTLGQAVLGGLVWWAFPIAWHHAMRVGPGYYAFGQHLW